ncbi:zn 2cys6 transcription factor [Sarocladium implicatum]|nr:zn 2cys6 transcription factor [Sarocladium implicatum]
MKPKSSCDSCRQRHRKCITQPNATRCNGCTELDRQCTLSPVFQFRPSKLSHPSPGHESQDSSPSLQSQPSQTPRSPRPQAGSGVTDGSQTHMSPASQQDASTIRLNNAAPVGAASSHSSSTHAPPRLTLREAFLYRTWTQKIALISDAIDDERHFAVTVSRLALQHDVLLNGILGLASRFDRLATDAHTTESDMESAFYHGRCIELLIQLLDKPVETYDATLLAAVVLSRLYEENDTETDSLTYHLAGTSTLLGHGVITRLAVEGGLAEAACWVHLRQAIYIAIVHRQHLNVPLGVYEHLTAFRKDNDSSYANRMVYHFARIVRLYFPQQSAQRSAAEDEKASWQRLQEELDGWYESRPVSFEPVYYEARRDEDPFPRIWMVSDVATVALQYYYSGQIIIQLHQDKSPHSNEFEAAKSRIAYEVCSPPYDPVRS